MSKQCTGFKSPARSVCGTAPMDDEGEGENPPEQLGRFTSGEQRRRTIIRREFDRALLGAAQDFRAISLAESIFRPWAQMVIRQRDRTLLNARELLWLARRRLPGADRDGEIIGLPPGPTGRSREELTEHVLSSLPPSTRTITRGEVLVYMPRRARGTEQIQAVVYCSRIKPRDGSTLVTAMLPLMYRGGGFYVPQDREPEVYEATLDTPVQGSRQVLLPPGWPVHTDYDVIMERTAVQYRDTHAGHHRAWTDIYE